MRTVQHQMRLLYGLFGPTGILSVSVPEWSEKYDIIGVKYAVRWRRYCDHFVTMCVCVCVCVCGYVSM